MDQSMKSKIIDRIKKDPTGVLQTLRSAGVHLSPDEERKLRAGQIDSQLEQRFNAKVLGMMGVTSSSSGVSGSGSTGGTRGSSKS